MPNPVHPLRQGTTWAGIATLVLVVYFWFHRAAAPAWKHLVFGAVLGLVVLLLAATWRRSLATYEAARDPGEQGE